MLPGLRLLKISERLLPWPGPSKTLPPKLLSGALLPLPVLRGYTRKEKSKTGGGGQTFRGVCREKDASVDRSQLRGNAG